MSTIASPRSYHPIASQDVKLEKFEKGGRFALNFRHLTSSIAGEDYHVGVLLEELPAGKQSNQLHFHMSEEEHVFILEGICTLRLGDEMITMQSGDYVVFPAGRKVGHCLVNETDGVCRYLVIGERIPNEVCVYPDSNKVQASWMNERYDRGSLLDYWAREAAD